MDRIDYMVEYMDSQEILLNGLVKYYRRKRMEITFYPNGNTSVFDGEEHYPLLQHSWLDLFAKFLESRGINPTEHDFVLPDGTLATLFQTKDNHYTWRWRSI